MRKSECGMSIQIFAKAAAKRRHLVPWRVRSAFRACADLRIPQRKRARMLRTVPHPPGEEAKPLRIGNVPFVVDKSWRKHCGFPFPVVVDVVMRLVLVVVVEIRVVHQVALGPGSTGVTAEAAEISEAPEVCQYPFSRRVR